MRNPVTAFVLICLLFALPSLARANQDQRYLVWPPASESGTFYLSTERNSLNHRFSRKGYIRAMTPIALQLENGQPVTKWMHETQSGDEHKYVQFVSATGAFGYIKKSSIKPMTELAEYEGRQLLTNGFDKVVVPLHPLEQVVVNRLGRDNRLIRWHSFSRSSHDLIVSDGHTEKVELPGDVRKELLRVRYFMPLADGSRRITEGWIEYRNLHRSFELLSSAVDVSARIVDKSELSFGDKVRKIWQHWINDYDEDKLQHAMRKECGSEVTLSMAIKGQADLPVSLVKLAANAQGQVSYRFPRGYRYKTDYLEDMGRERDIKILKTIKCKANTNSDWHAERAVFVDDQDVFELFQDDLSNSIGEYFATPVASGPLVKREKMIQLKSLENSDLDYYSAFFKLGNYMQQNVYDKLELDDTQRARLNTLVIEQITQF